jgi:RNA polymerase-binding transcription factor DksA
VQQSVLTAFEFATCVHFFRALQRPFATDYGGTNCALLTDDKQLCRCWSKPVKTRDRSKTLHDALKPERLSEASRIRQLRRRFQDHLPLRRDEANAVWALPEADMRANLIERSRERLCAIKVAPHRVEAGSLGACDECGVEIPIERLRLLSFGATCLSCQHRLELERVQHAPPRRLNRVGVAVEIARSDSSPGISSTGRSTEIPSDPDYLPIDPLQE